MTHGSPRKQVALWALYDFASSMALAVFGVYISEWLVVRHKVSDLSFNMIFIVSSLMVFVTAPLLGVIVDKVRVKLPSLRIVALHAFFCLFLIGLLTSFASATSLVINEVIVLIILAQYFYQLSYVFYNPLLKELGPPEAQAKISGLGQAAGGVGQIIGLIATLPLATGAIYLIGHRDESQVFLPTAIFFLLCILPMLLFFKEKSRPPQSVEISIKKEIGDIWHKFIALGKYPGVHRFLLAYFFFNDAILTAAHNFPIYIQQVLHIDGEPKSILLAGIIVSAALGAVASGWIAKKVGEKRLLVSLLGLWLIVLPLTSLQRSVIPFTICMVLVGLLLGATSSIARAVMTYLAPSKELAHAFSYYAMSERLASFLGPFAWGLVTYALLPQGIVRYQVALATLTIFVAIGLVIARKIPSQYDISETLTVTA